MIRDTIPEVILKAIDAGNKYLLCLSGAVTDYENGQADTPSNQELVVQHYTAWKKYNAQSIQLLESDMPSDKSVTGINMTNEVYEVLDMIGMEADRSRSWLIEDMVRSNPEFIKACKKHGVIVPTRGMNGDD